jgi:hypothetical protein
MRGKNDETVKLRPSKDVRDNKSTQTRENRSQQGRQRQPANRRDTRRERKMQREMGRSKKECTSKDVSDTLSQHRYRHGGKKEYSTTKDAVTATRGHKTRDYLGVAPREEEGGGCTGSCGMLPLLPQLLLRFSLFKSRRGGRAGSPTASTSIASSSSKTGSSSSKTASKPFWD